MDEDYEAAVEEYEEDEENRSALPAAAITTVAATPPRSPPQEQGNYDEAAGIPPAVAREASSSPQAAMWATTVASMSSSQQDSIPSPAVEAPQSRLRQRAADDSDFKRISMLGIGSFGRVVLTKHRNTGKLYALKLIACAKLTAPKHLERTQTERDVLCRVEHRHIVKLYFAYRTETQFALVFEYCPGGELFYHLCRARSLSSSCVAFYAAELALALDCAHSHAVVYRDVKPENCLLDARGHLKLVDFGLAKAGISDRYSGAHSICGTLEYMAPDVLAKKPYGYGLAVDWWGLGILAYELLTGFPPWRGGERPKLFQKICKQPLKIPPNLSLEAGSLVASLLRRHPKQRLFGLEQMKRHSFFKDVDFGTVSDSKSPPIRPCGDNPDNSHARNNFDAKFTALGVREKGEKAHKDKNNNDSGSSTRQQNGGRGLVVDTNSLPNWEYSRPPSVEDAS